MSSLPPRRERHVAVVDEGALHQYATLIPNTVIRGLKSHGLSVYAKWLYVYIKSRAGEGGTCFTNTTTIVEETGISRGQVSVAKRELVDAGLIALHHGKNRYRNTDHMKIKDIWPANMQEFSSVHDMNSDTEQETQETQEDEEVSVHDMNSDEAQCSLYELSVHGTYQRSIPEEVKPQDLDSLTTFENLSGAMNGVHAPAETSAAQESLPVVRQKKTPKPLAEDDWVRKLLLDYRDRFDFDALNDDEWWTDTGNSFPEFAPQWVELAFASLSRWLRDNPKRLPRGPRGWKTRMGYSLNWYYDKHMRRESRGAYQKR